MSQFRGKLIFSQILHAALFGIPMTLIGCTQLPVIGTATTARLMTVSIQAGETIQTVARKYDARVLTFHPQTGQAVLALSSERAARLSREAFEATDPNENTLESQQDTEAAAAVNSNMSGWTTWASGWSVYGSGLVADLVTSATSSLNYLSWNKILLPQALALAPKAGTGVIVAVIDTGIDLAHPAFNGRLVSSDKMWDFVNNDATPQEVYVDSSSKGYGHGTCVAGIVAQVAPNAKIMPLRVLGPTGSGNSDGVVAAIDWAVSHGAKVINLSLGSQYLKSLDSEIDWATSNGVLVVSSTGNTGNTSVTFPAKDSRYPDDWGDLSVGVASTNLNDQKSSFSTYGNVEITAPGENILVPAPNLRVASWSGTSMASPMVAGGFALALGQRSYSWYSLLALGRSMGNSADSLMIKDLSYGYRLGNGRINLQRFMQYALLLPN
jgi:subtilisin family serine protease